LDLLRIIDRMELDHARAIATRLDIGPSLIRHLKSIQDEEVQIALEDNDALMGNLETRSADSLFAEIDARELQSDLESELGAVLEVTELEADTEKVPEPALDPTFEPEPAPLNAAEHALLAAAGRGSNLKMPPMATPMENDFNFGDAFEKVARANSHQGMAVLMQKRFNLALDTAHQVLQDRSGDTLAVLLNAAKVKPAQANRIQLLTHPSIGLSSHNALRSVRFFAQLNSESSLNAVNQWPKAKDPQIRHETQFEEGHGKRDVVRSDTGKSSQLETQTLQATG